MHITLNGDLVIYLKRMTPKQSSKRPPRDSAIAPFWRIGADVRRISSLLELRSLLAGINRDGGPKLEGRQTGRRSAPEASSEPRDATSLFGMQSCCGLALASSPNGVSANLIKLEAQQAALKSSR